MTADPRNEVGWTDTLFAINSLVGGPGAFHVSAGDVWQLDVGSTRTESADGSTFFDVVVRDDQALVNV